MTKTRSLPLLILSFTAAVAFAPLGTGTASADTCGNGAAIVVAGTNAPRNGHGVPTGGVTGVGARYLNSGYKVQYVDYPTSLWPLGPISYDDDVALGKAATQSAISEYQQRCPGKPVVVSGYSQGARVAGDVLSDVANGRQKGNQISRAGLSGELYSDPRRVGRPNSTGVENALIGFIPGLTMSGPRDGGFGDIPVKQVCTEGDGICDVPDPLFDPVGAADSFLGYFLKHGYYPGRMNHDPTDKAKWGGLKCEQQGATDDCVTPLPSSTSLLARAEHALTGQTNIFGDAADYVDNRAPLDLAPGVTIAQMRPLIGGGPDSSSGNLSVGVEAVVAGAVGVQVERNWGTKNDLTVGVDLGIGMTDNPSVDDALIPSTKLLHVETTVPMIDSRKLLYIALDPTGLMGSNAPGNSVLLDQAPTTAPSVTVEVAPGTADARKGTVSLPIGG
ncbi:PE-PPE domain-containing protein [Gordonia sp. PDNC005]|uniref:PE-PPE domain-containing protein n=1 Tax=unclassified Gordonia (in: high G+C Gram-positive bacteria) TaxID=2657482 RepID=UPI0019629BB4|nr:PE-PPE domain-containing protein [Gordonia sp. PDNC005]QRY63459.1 PE-PPE domain-containing protein [Gordonia sp. PDNC005]